LLNMSLSKYSFVGILSNTWTIRNFTELRTEEHESEEMEMPEWPFKDISWKFSIKPGFVREPRSGVLKEQRFIGVFLTLVSPHNRDITATFTISIGNGRHSRKKVECIFNGTWAPKCGWGEFLPRQLVLRPGTRFLSGSQMEFQCKIELSSKCAIPSIDVEDYCKAFVCPMDTNGVLYNVLIRTNEKDVWAHRKILYGRSSVFNMLLPDPKATLVVIYAKTLDPEAIECCLTYLSTGYVPTAVMSKALISVAKHFQIQYLVRLCERSVQNNH
jgi:hypothetical protein